MASSSSNTCLSSNTNKNGGKEPSTYRAYPLSMRTELEKKFKNVKTIHIVRHAEGTHNVNKQYKDEVNLDARLTPKGISQCQELAQRVQQASSDNNNNNELFDVSQTRLIVTSTMTRCIQTALHSFPHLLQLQQQQQNNNSIIRFVAHEGIRETVNYACDRRRPISEKRQEFNMVDFDTVDINTDDDEIWNSYQNRVASRNWGDAHLESAELYMVAKRGRAFFDWLGKTQSESEIIMCTHAAFLRCILSWGQEGGVESMLPQVLDERPNKDAIHYNDNIPLFHYHRGEGPNGLEFEQYIRKDFGNSEMRTFVVVFDDDEEISQQES